MFFAILSATEPMVCFRRCPLGNANADRFRLGPGLRHERQTPNPFQGARTGRKTRLVTAVADGRFRQSPIVPHPGRESLHLPGVRMGIPNRLFQPAEETQPAKGMTPKIRGRNRGNVPAPLVNSRLHRRQTERNVRIRQVQQIHESELNSRDPACDGAHHKVAAARISDSLEADMDTPPDDCIRASQGYKLQASAHASGAASSGHEGRS